jgi:phosphoribosylglycinamide formyltransferase-1
MIEEAPKPKVVVLISGNGSNLQALIDNLGTEIPADIVCVISNRPDAAGLDRAKNASIHTRVIDHADFEQRELFDAALIREIDKHAADLIVLAGFMRILSNDFVRRYQGRLLNIHPSLLPKYPGLSTHQRALNAKDKKHGVTVHFVIPELDAGPNIIQAEVPVLKQDDAESLANRVQKQEYVIYPIAVKWFVEGRLQLHGDRALLDQEVLPESGLYLDSPHTLH